ncbi:MAG: S8 family serine peptidase [Trueperaceae bacterium]|nr:S8 family serine peptidase [Trueperaceae bacterium]
MKIVFRSLILVILLVVMTACGGSSPNNPNNPSPGTLSGTIAAPVGGNIQNSVLIACYVQSNTCNVNSANTTSVRVSQAGGSASFQFRNLAEGSYAIFAFKDTNGDDDFRDVADYQGCYGSGQDCAVVSPPAANLNIQLFTELPPVVPGSISGTLYMPGQVDGAGLDSRRYDLRQTPAQPDIRAGEVIVKFKSTGLTTLAEVEPLASYRFAGQGLERSRLMGLQNTALYRVNLDVGQTLALVADLNARPDVEYAEPNYMMYALKVPNDEFYEVQWHYPLMNLEKAWDIEDGTSNPVTVAVVDTGLLPHPDLAGVNVGGYDFITSPDISGDGDGRDPDPTDLGQESGYHGGHVAGTVAAKTNNGSGLAGVSWGAKIVPIRVLGVTGGGTMADIIDGTLWAGGESISGIPSNPNPAKVINLSLGGEQPCSAAEEEAFQILKNKGIVVVVAAGNSDSDAGFFSPASCDNVITVGAIGPTGERAPYSNYGSKIDVMATGGDTGKSFDFNGQQLAAGVWSTLKDDETGNFTFAAYQGTSMAAPHIAGIAALMLSKDPNLTPDQVLARLVDSAVPLSASKCLRPSGNECGAGLVDAAAALGSTSTTPPPPPPDTSNVLSYTVAFYCADLLCNNFDFDRSGIVALDDARQQVPYQITGLENGAYAVGAFQDLDNNGDLSDNEPFGVYDEDGDGFLDYVFLDNQGIGGVDIELEPFTASTAGAMTQLMRASVPLALKSFAERKTIPLQVPAGLEPLLSK